MSPMGNAIKRGRRSVGVGLAGICALVAIGAASAWGAGETIQASPTSDTFTKSSFTIDQGQVATFQNGSVTGSSHNVVSIGNGPDGRNLFRSNTISSGQAPVNGTQYLTQGTFRFVCTIHAGMEANLVVSANGTPVARPDIELKILSSQIEKVRGSRRLKVKLSALAESDNVDLVAKKGAKKLGSKSDLDLAAGASRTVKVPVSRAGKTALKGLDSARVKVTGTVPFGAPDTAKRKLR
jgi:plastocyanin